MAASSSSVRPPLASWYSICLGSAILGTIASVGLWSTKLQAAPSQLPGRDYSQKFEAAVFPDNSDSSYDAERDLLLKGCGEICDTSIGVLKNPPDLFYDVPKSVDCKALYENTESDAPATHWPPPEGIPSYLRDDYTQGGLIKVGKWYIKQGVTGKKKSSAPKWTPNLINSNIGKAKNGKLRGYGKESLHIQALLRRHPEKVEGKHLFVLGTRVPWVESILLAAGASKITTIEYRNITSLDDRIETMTPADVRKRFLETNGTEPKFDGGVSHSSVEHSGLGRYGDRLNPWGDLQAVAKAWCITKPQGFFFLGVPGSKTDEVVWNAHRVYGAIRWPQLVANWHFLNDSTYPRLEDGSFFQNTEGFLQNMFVFQRMDPPVSQLRQVES